MTENTILKTIILLLIGMLFLVLLGASDSFGSLRWSVLLVGVTLSGLSFSSRRYYWGIVFALFVAIFNPWIHPSFPKMAWYALDGSLAITLVAFFLDYFRNYHKGVLFERFIQGKFPDSHWVLVENTKDLSKKLQRIVESDMNPDFVFRNRVNGREMAVECKYRSDYIIGKHGDAGIWWKEVQGARYENFSKKRGIPVYIAIGIGGNPKSPKFTAYVPIEVIQKNYFKFIPKKVLDSYSQIPLG
jgi:hypothetical protein